MKKFIIYYSHVICIVFLLAFFSLDLFSQAFPCDGKIYFGSNATPCGISSIDGYISGTPTVTLVCPITSGSMNGLGANPIDRLLYFSGQGGIRRIDASCNDVLVCPGVNSSSACFDNVGRYWIPGGGGIRGYDLNTCTVVKTLTFSVTVPGPDFMFNPCDNKFYWCDAASMMSMDTNGVVNTYTVGFGGSGNFGGVCMGSDGNLYGMPNGTSDLYQFNTTTIASSGTVCSTAPTTTCGHDMASFPCGTLEPDFSATTLCANTVQFTDSTQGWVLQWQWNFGDGGTDTVNRNPSHVYPGPGTYTVSLSVSAGPACLGIPPATYTTVVTIPPTFSVTVNGATSLCPGASATLSASGGTTYSWSNGATTSSIVVNPTGTTTYSLIASDGSCFDTSSAAVTIATNLLAGFSSTTVCFGTPTSFTDMSTGTPNSWSWNFGDGKTSASQNPSNTYNNPGTYSVSLVVTSAAGCVDSVTQTVAVNPLPAVNFSSTTVCVGNPSCFTDLTTISSGTLTSWSWNMGDPGLPGNTSGAQVLCITYTASGTYSVILTVTSSGGCQGMAILQATVTPAPAASFTASSVCQNQATVFTNTSTGNPTQWSWNFGDGGTSSLQSPSHTYLSAGTYTATLVVSSAANCTDTIANVVLVHPLPVADFTSDSVCLGNVTSFTDLSFISSGSISAWNWNLGNGSVSSQQNPLLIYSSAGTYSVTLTVTSNNGCKNSITRQTKVFPLPQADFSSTPGSTVSFTDIVAFTDLSTSNVVQWFWNFGDGTKDSVRNPLHTYADTGSYLVTLLVISDHGCVDTVEHVLTVRDFTFYIPNAFTPNQDGWNEFFFASGIGIREYELSIFDRWGNIIFYCHVNDLPQIPACRWDGRVIGIGSDEIVQEDVYIWKVQLTNVYKKVLKYVGTVTVVK